MIHLLQNNDNKKQKQKWNDYYTNIWIQSAIAGLVLWWALTSFFLSFFFLLVENADLLNQTC